MTKPHINVVICTPGHSLMGIYVKSLLALIDRLKQEGLSVAWSNEYSSHVADAREMTLSGTNQNLINENRPFHGNITYDTLLWIDSDIAFNPEDAVKLVKSDKKIISGAYMLASGEVMAYKELLGRAYNYDEVINMTEPVQIAGCGFGFVAVKAGVFESLTRPWFQSALVETKDGITFPMMGEDLSWCKRATDAGFEIWFDPTVRVTHHKMMKLTWEGIRP